MVKLSELKINNANPRQIKDKKYKELKKSIQEFPKMLDLRPIIIDDDGTILGGNMRYRALLDLGYKEVPDSWVRKASELTDEEKRRFIIVDNVQFGEWDFEALANEWDANLLVDWGLEGLNLDISQEIDINDYDNYEIIDENEIKTDIKKGDLIEIGEHKLLCGDSTNYEDIKKLMNNEKADMIFLDPPFDLSDNYTQHIFKFVNDNCHIFIMNSDKNLIDIIHNNIKYFKRFFAVDFKQARLVSNKQPMTRVDLIAEFSVGKSRFRNLKDGFSTLIECSKIHNKNVKGNYLHEQAKKVELPANFIKHYTDEGDIVCDYFLGAGSTLVASHILKRKCYGIEIEPKYCQIIIDRMKENFNDIKIKINGKEL